jgi:hypothetical protein
MRNAFGPGEGALVMGNEAVEDRATDSYSQGAVRASLRTWEHDLDWSILDDDGA